MIECLRERTVGNQGVQRQEHQQRHLDRVEVQQVARRGCRQHHHPTGQVDTQQHDLRGQEMQQPFLGQSVNCPQQRRQHHQQHAGAEHIDSGSGKAQPLRTEAHDACHQHHETGPLQPREPLAEQPQTAEHQQYRRELHHGLRNRGSYVTQTRHVKDVVADQRQHGETEQPPCHWRDAPGATQIAAGCDQRQQHQPGADETKPADRHCIDGSDQRHHGQRHCSPQHRGGQRQRQSQAPAPAAAPNHDASGCDAASGTISTTSNCRLRTPR